MKSFFNILPVLLLAPALCPAQLIIQNNAQVVTTGAALITLQNIDLNNNGTFSQQTGGGKVLFTGSSSNVIAGAGGAVPVFDTLEIAKTGGATVSLGRTCNISSALKFTSGNMNINGWNLNFGNTGSLIGENENSRVVDLAGSGNLIASRVLNAPNAVDIANFGAVITSSANLGQTAVLRKAANTLSNNGTPVSTISRQYLIQPTNNTGLNATLRLRYFDSELNGMTEASLEMYKSQSPYILTTNEGFTSRDATGNYVEKTGVNDFSIWSLSASGVPLPVTLSSFDVACDHNTVLINWVTADEQQVRQFKVQKSTRQGDCETIATLPAKGGSHTETRYSFADPVPVAERALYRIAIQDTDGKIAYSDIAKAQCSSMLNEASIWPNPVQDDLNIAIDVLENTRLQLQLFDSKGALLHTQNNNMVKGANQMKAGMSGFAAGIYQLVLHWGNGQQKTVKIVKR